MLKYMRPLVTILLLVKYFVLQTMNVKVLVAQPCPTLCNPMDFSPSGSSVHGILQERILEWVAKPSSRDLPNPETEPASPALQVDSLPSEPPGSERNFII